MGIEFDPRKSARDEAERQLLFERAVDFERSEAIIIPDERNDYPESRFVTVGYLDTRLHVLCFTPIEGEFGLLVFVKPTGERLANMGNHLPLIDEEGEVRELTKEDFARARPASEVLP